MKIRNAALTTNLTKFTKTEIKTTLFAKILIKMKTKKKLLQNINKYCKSI